MYSYFLLHLVYVKKQSKINAEVMAEKIDNIEFVVANKNLGNAQVKGKAKTC